MNLCAPYLVYESLTGTSNSGLPSTMDTSSFAAIQILSFLSDLR